MTFPPTFEEAPANQVRLLCGQRTTAALHACLRPAAPRLQCVDVAGHWKAIAAATARPTARAVIDPARCDALEFECVPHLPCLDRRTRALLPMAPETALAPAHPRLQRVKPTKLTTEVGRWRAARLDRQETKA